MDRSISRLDLTQEVDYGIFLAGHLSLMRSSQNQWRDEDASDFARLRETLLDDCSLLGVATPEVPDEPTQELAVRLGIAYVIRGSRLGSVILRRRLAPGLPSRYFDCVLSLAWPEFLLQLEAAHGCDRLDPTAGVIRGAQAAFARFQQ